MEREIEIKALLTEDKYNELRKVLPIKFKQIVEDTLTTVRFRPKDIRVRWSDKINELVFKDGDPTVHSRKEITISLKDEKDCQSMIKMLEELNFKADPSWVKVKHDFVTDDGYTLSLQFIENFAYLLEAEIISNDESHIPKLKELLRSLGCEPIDPEEFNTKIQEYIRTNQ